MTFQQGDSWCPPIWNIWGSPFQIWWKNMFETTKQKMGPVGTISLTKSPHAPQDESPESDGSTIHLVSAFFWGGINSTWLTWLGPSTNWLCCPSRKDFEPLRWSLRWPSWFLTHQNLGVPGGTIFSGKPIRAFREISRDHLGNLWEICETCGFWHSWN